MSRTIRRCLLAIACLAGGVASPAAAQHHDGGHGSFHHGGGYHSSWGHVVPSHHQYSGIYYSHGGANYYTPVAPVQVQVLRPALNPGPIYTAPVVEPIAPRSVRLEFGGFKQYEDLSGRLEAEANRWCLEMHHNYRHNADFAVTYREAYKILTTAKFVHAAEHRQDRAAIRAELTALEPLFHHVQEKVKSWTRDEHRLIGEGGLNGKAEVVESILHHLLYDVGVEPRHDATPAAPPPPPDDVAPPPAR